MLRIPTVLISKVIRPASKKVSDIIIQTVFSRMLSLTQGCFKVPKTFTLTVPLSNLEFRLNRV